MGTATHASDLATRLGNYLTQPQMAKTRHGTLGAKPEIQAYPSVIRSLTTPQQGVLPDAKTLALRPAEVRDKGCRQ